MVSEEKLKSERIANIELFDTSRERYWGYPADGEYRSDLEEFKDGKICGALSSSGKMCRRRPSLTSGSGRCVMHGGGSPSGMEASQYKHGLYSKDLPTGLVKRFEDAIESPELSDLEQDIALVRARIAELLDHVGANGGKKAFTEAYAAFKKWQETPADSKNYLLLTDRFFARMEQARFDTNAWDEIYEAQNVLKGLIAQQQKKMMLSQQFIEVKQAMMLVSSLMNIVKVTIEGLDGMYMDREAIEKTNEEIARKFKRIAS